MMLDLASYDRIIVAFSGGKDSLASLLVLLEAGVPAERIELWHHDVDGGAEAFMDWPSTSGYVRAVASCFRVPCYFSWREGGFLREMLRRDAPTAPILFETPDGLDRRGGEGPCHTRLRFPQISASLSVRWCSAALKIDVGDTALRNQDRFLDSRTLFVTGERAEESPGRARYAVFGPHRTDTRNGTRRRRHVDHWRPVHIWSEQQVWAIIERFGVVPAIPYQLGFGRLSCQFCIFGSTDHFATLRVIDPERFELLARYERDFGCTIRRDIDLHGLADRGQVFDIVRRRPNLIA